MTGRIVCFGDSLTQQGTSGWCSLLARAYERRCDVVNRGYSGFNSRKALELLPSLFPHEGDAAAADLFVLWFGANDATDPSNTNQHVPIEEFEANLVAIMAHWLRRSRGQRGTRILVLSPPMVDSGRWPDRSCARATEYGAAAERAANKINCGAWKAATGDGAAAGTGASAGAALRPAVFVPIGARMEALAPEQWAAQVRKVLSIALVTTERLEGAAAADPCEAVIAAAASDAPNGDTWRRFMRDGLHFNGIGDSWVADQVVAGISAGFELHGWSVLPRLSTAVLPFDRPERMALAVPGHRDVDNDDPAAALAPAALQRRVASAAVEE